MTRKSLACAALSATLAAGAMIGSAGANTTHAGWPTITGIHIKLSASGGTADARPGHGLVVASPSDRSCRIHQDGQLLHKGCYGPIGHNELLGDHGSDTIWAGKEGDVIWGDNEPSGQPTSQVDNLHGGPGNDFIYSSHGYNHIWTGAGDDEIALIYGHGIVTCNGPGLKTLVVRLLPQNRHFQLDGCNHTRLITQAA